MIHLKRLRREWRKRLGRTSSDFVCNTAGVLLAIAIVLTLPITFPIALILMKLEVEHRRQDAQHSACVGCGSILGVAALALADVNWENYLRSHQQQRDALKTRIRTRTLWAICPSCGTGYNYLEKERTFIPLSDLEFASYRVETDTNTL